jgi:hypothetical protein
MSVAKPTPTPQAVLWKKESLEALFVGVGPGGRWAVLWKKEPLEALYVAVGLAVAVFWNTGSLAALYVGVGPKWAGQWAALWTKETFEALSECLLWLVDPPMGPGPRSHNVPSLS